jgi:septum formation protein
LTRIILASASPRRRELLAALLPEFEVVAADIPEPVSGDPVHDAVSLAEAKLAAVSETLSPGDDAVIIAADTIVHDGKKAYGKPADADDAVRMLRELQGREHRVITGLAVGRGTQVEGGYSEAWVHMASLRTASIAEYVASGRPLDKAGAYAIQDEDVPTVDRIEGCYCAVMGLPLWRLREMLVAAGVECADPGASVSRCASCPERFLGA